MKRWIHASRDIEYKIKDYIAAWAKDDVKAGEPMADFRQFKEEMKSKGLKADEDGYDYYVACYNNACKGSPKKVNSSYDISDGTEYIDDFLEELAYETCDLNEEFDESEFEEFKKVAKDNGFIANEGDFQVYLNHVKDIRGED